MTEDRNAKVSKASVDYHMTSPYAVRRCGSCVMFRPPHSCTLVEGQIKPEGVCDRWEKK